MKKILIVSTLVVAGVITSPALVYAQSNPGTTNTTRVTDREDGTNWGWLGLLGLAGLIGLKRSDRDNVHGVGKTRATT